jgi:hypothetical protein
MMRREATLGFAVVALAVAGLGSVAVTNAPPATAAEMGPCGQDRYANGRKLVEAVADGNNSAGHHAIALRPGCIYAIDQTLVIRARQANDAPLSMRLVGAGAVVERSVPDGGAVSGEAIGRFRIFDVEPGAVLGLDGIEVRGGSATGPDADGGGIRVGAGGMLTLERVTLSGNRSTAGGAALAVFGDAVLVDTTISANTSGPNGSIVLNATRLRLQGVTVSGNRGDGGATILNTGVAEIVRSTLAENQGQAAVVENTATLRMAATTVATNQSAAVLDRADAVVFSSILAENAGANCAGDVVTVTRTISTDATCTGTVGSVTLGSLRNNGGPTRTKALRNNSSGVDPGPCDPGTGLGFQASDLAYDQRGVARDGQCDIGAFERLDADQDGYDDLTETG